MSNLYGKSCTPNLGGVRDFYTAEEVLDLLRVKADKFTTYTKSEIDNLLAGIEVGSGFATSEQGDLADSAVQPEDLPSPQTLSHTTLSLDEDEVEDFALASGNLFALLSVSSSTPSWIRVYGTTAARDLDVRTSPGGNPPDPGSDFYAELVTTTSPQTIRLSPLPIVQGTSGNTYIRVQNLDTVAREIELEFTIMNLLFS